MPRDLGGQRMQGAIEALLSGLVLRGLGPALSGILMAAPLKKVARAQLKKIYVLDERGEMAGEYILDQDCPIDYNDFLKVLPDEGIGDRDSLFVGEYVFTAFQSGKFVFVLLSRGQLAPEDVNWTALLLTAADSHLAAAASRPAPARAAEPKPDLDKGLAERDARARGRAARLAQREGGAKDAVALREKERAEAGAGAGEKENTRREIESRVADLSQRFTSMAKERLVASHRPPGEVSEEVRKAMEGEKAELARERKFLQRRAIELLDREERVRDREARVDERDREFGRREQDLATREQDLDRQRTLLAQAKPQAPEVRAEPDEAKKDIERRVKIIQQKALELLDREEKLRRRAAAL